MILYIINCISDSDGSTVKGQGLLFRMLGVQVPALPSCYTVGLLSKALAFHCAIKYIYIANKRRLLLSNTQLKGNNLLHSQETLEMCLTTFTSDLIQAHHSVQVVCH